MTRKATYIVTDRIQGPKPANDRNEPLGVTNSPREALNMVKRASHDGRIEMRENDGTTRTFTGKHYDAVAKRQPGHRTDRQGSDQYHGFIEHCETAGFGSPVATAKQRTAGKRTRISTKRKKTTARKRK